MGDIGKRGRSFTILREIDRHKVIETDMGDRDETLVASPVLVCVHRSGTRALVDRHYHTPTRKLHRMQLRPVNVRIQRRCTPPE